MERKAQNTYAKVKRQSRSYADFSMASEEEEYFTSGVDSEGYYRTWDFDYDNLCSKVLMFS